MTRDGTTRPIRRAWVALLAVWMTIFAVLAAVHNHTPQAFMSRHTALAGPVAGALQVGSCPACLASHVPVQTPDTPVVLSAPAENRGTAPACRPQQVRSACCSIRSSRAPPASSAFAV